MASVLRRRWTSNPGPGAVGDAGQDRTYETYLPDPLVGRSITLAGETAAEIADAEAAVVRLNLKARSPRDADAMARLLLRAEAVASSRIDGLEVGVRRLLRAQAEQATGVQSSDLPELEVLNNIEAMKWAIEHLSHRRPKITTDDLLAIHRHLVAGTRLDAYAGKIRTEQNWVGGSGDSPCSADFVPPPPQVVGHLLDDLCAFCNTDSLPAIAQAAIAHAQFETIHPFVGGNGRTGRALIHVILRRRGLAAELLPPVSLLLSSWSGGYVGALMATRYQGPPESAAAQSGLDGWLALFAAATTRAVSDAELYEASVFRLREAWRARLGRVRAGSALDLLIDVLPGAPVVTVKSAASLIGRSQQAVNEAIPRLLDARILRQTTLGRRNRAFEATELVDAFTDLERRLPGPTGDSR